MVAHITKLRTDPFTFMVANITKSRTDPFTFTPLSKLGFKKWVKRVSVSGGMRVKSETTTHHQRRPQ